MEYYTRLRDLFESFFTFSDCKIMEPEPAAKDEQVSRELWDISCKMVRLDPEYNPFKSDL